MNQRILSLLNVAIQNFQNGNLEQARLQLNDVLKMQPKNFDALHILGVIYGIKSNHKEALNYFRKAIKVNSLNNFVHFNLAKALSELGDDIEAIKHISKAVQLEPKHPESWLNYGKILSKLNRTQEAATHYDEALKLRPNYPEALFNKGTALHELKLYKEAITQFDKAIHLNPEYIEAWYNKANTHSDLQEFKEAIVSYDKAIQLDPNHVEAWYNRAINLTELKQYDNALISYDTVIQLNSNRFDAWCNKGILLNTVKRHDDAIKHFDEAIKIKPNYEKALSNKGITLKNIGKYSEALICYNKAIEINPDFSEAQNNRALLNLYLKNFKDGWGDYHARLKSSSFSYPKDPQLTPLWNGDYPCNHLLVVNEQGIGDEVFYASMLNSIKHKVGKITLMTDRRLISAFQRSFPDLNVIDKKESINLQQHFDAQIAAGELPRLLGIDSEFLRVNRQPYIKTDSALTQHLRSLPTLQNQFKCGLAWKSSNKSLGEEKSITLQHLSPVLQTIGCQFINLQYGEIKDDIQSLEAELREKITVVDGIDPFNDIDGLFSMIELCDIVITTSNVTAHMAGSIGKKTLLLAPNSHGRIWYWHDDEINIWYPSIKQYYQNNNFSWANAIEKIAKELELEIAGKN